MRLSERAIEMPRLVVLAAAVVCLVGVVAIFSLPKERTPRIRLPVVLVTVPNPGASPETNEKQIIDRVEEEVESSLDNLRDDGAIQSLAVNGAAVMLFFFDDDVSTTEARRDVESLIHRVKGRFPPAAQQDPGPIIKEVAFNDFPIIQVSVAGGQDGWHRRRVADELKSRIEKVPGIAGVDTFGGLEREVQIEIDPNLMVMYGFSYPQIEGAVRRANVDAPSGSIQSTDGNEQRVRTDTKLDSVDAIRSTPVGTRDGKPVVLADVADVRMGHKPLTSIARYNGQDAVVLLVKSKTDADVLAATQTVQGLVDRFVQSGANQNTQIGTMRSQSREIGYMINQLTTSAAYGTILVIVILWVAMGWRNAALIGLAVPLAILGTAAMMWLVKHTIAPDLAINNMTMFATILVVGMVVDGCIIVGENIYRHRELGRSPVDAAKRGITEVGGSLVSAYLTTFAAFGPMFMVGGVVGQFMQVLPVVVLFALCSAMLVDHFLLPILSVYLMKTPPGGQPPPGRSRADLSPDEAQIAQVEQLAGDSVAKRVYAGWLRTALAHRGLVLGLTILLTATPIVLFAGGVIGLEFFPDSDRPELEVYFELPLGSSMQGRTVQVADQIEQAVIRAIRPDEWYRPHPDGPPIGPVTTIGEPGALTIRIDNEEGSGPEFGMVYAELALAEERSRSSEQIRRAILAELPDLPGISVRAKRTVEGPPVGAPVLIRVLARSGSPVTMEALAARAAVIEGKLRQVPGTYDVSNDYRLRPQVSVTPNRTVASLFDIDAAQIATSVNYALDGVIVGEVDFGTDENPELRLRNRPSDRDQIEDLENLPIRSPTGKIVSLDQVAQVQRVRNQNVIRHYDHQRVINLRAQLHDGVLADTVRQKLAQALSGRVAPTENIGAASGPASMASQAGTLQVSPHAEGRVLASDDQVVVEFGGENQERDDAMEDLNMALILAGGAMMLILTFKFNSFVQPLIVLFSVPLSLVGVCFGMLLCGVSFSVSSMIGVVALSGIVVNDAIVLVDFINTMRQAGVPMDRAVVYAGQLRLRPIILTTITTIGGLLPLGLNLAGGGEFWQPLTITIMFGLGFATMLQLFILPVACDVFHPRDTLLDPMQRPDLAGEPPQPEEPETMPIGQDQPNNSPREERLLFGVEPIATDPHLDLQRYLQ